jgi:CelD/BcsL family acetyltransferase involved in cellulose biosynthesis
LNHRPPSSSPPPKAKILKGAVELDAIAEDWHRIWAQDPHREIFQHFACVRSWIEAYGKEDQIRTVVVMDGEKVIGIVPLVIEGRCLRFAGHSTSDYNTILCTGDRAQVLHVAFTVLFDNNEGWDEILLESICEETGLSAVLSSMSRNSWQVETVDRVPCPTLRLQQDKGEILRRLLGKDKLRKTVRALQRLGTITFRHIEDREEARQHLPELIRQHIRRCAVDGRESPFLKGDSIKYCYALVEKMDPKTELRLSVLEIDGVPAAYHLGFRLDGKYLYYKPTFDVNLWGHSPGQVLLYYLLQYVATSEGLGELDFSSGGEAYKYHFSNQCRDNLTIRIRRPGLKASLCKLVHTSFRIGRKQAWRFHSLASVIARVVKTFERAQTRAAWRNTGLVRELFTSFVLSFERLVILSPKPHNTIDEVGGKAQGLSMITISFGELADVAARCPPLQDQLRRARVLMKAGHTPYLFRNNDHPLCVVWTREGHSLGFEETGSRRLFSLPATSLIVHSLWVVCLSPNSWQAVLDRLKESFPPPDRQAYIVAPARLLKKYALLRRHFVVGRRLISGQLFGKIDFSI